jgi:hypothetical protein
MRRSDGTMLAAMIVALASVSCAQPAPSGDPAGGAPDSRPTGSQQEQDWAAIERLESEARTIAPTRGCNSAAQCRTAPVGNRACGGPRYYLVYCGATTDSTALFAKLDGIVQAENAFNRRYNIASTCEFRMPPEIAFGADECMPEDRD